MTPATKPRPADEGSTVDLPSLLSEIVERALANPSFENCVIGFFSAAAMRAAGEDVADQTVLALCKGAEKFSDQFALAVEQSKS